MIPERTPQADWMLPTRGFAWTAILLITLGIGVNTAVSQTFKKITIQAAGSADPRTMRLQVLPNGDLMAHSVDVIDLLSYAYGVPSNPSPRLNALPGWAVDERYDIEAKADPDAVAASSEGSEAQARLQTMIRQLLADRFGLVMRVEQERMQVYALVVSGSGPRLHKSAVTTKDCILDSAPEGCHSFAAGFGHPLDANATSMEDLAHYIENWADLPVVDRTHLSGLFTVQTEGWMPMRLPPPPPNGNGHVNFGDLPTIFTVLGKLGLELHRQEEVLPVYTVERIEQPSLD
ncbi:MAG: TIGR03435 family protein [Acidobacteriaceae bacterium]